MKKITLIITVFFYANLVSQIKNDNTYKKKEMDTNLSKLISSIQYNDQRYRNIDFEKNKAEQRELDSLNLSKIDSIYKKYNTYIGKSLVGDKLSHVMWLVIQHSNISKMEYYLPIIASAVKNKELSSVPLAMLIDRIYSIKYGYQIFGSQQGVKLGDDKVRNKIKVKYDLVEIGR